jgi:D-xylose transport system ATP-binding protein
MTLSRTPAATPAPATTPVVEMRDIRVSFGGVHAVEGVTIDLKPGEVVGLVGGNGAGKSTLMRVLSGAHRADSGQILVEGKPVTIGNPRDAKALGIETIYQTLALADNIDAAGNVFLGRELRTRIGSLDDAAMESATRKVLGRLNPRFRNFKTAVKSLSGGQRQSIAIARALGGSPPIVLLDEPSSAMDAQTEGALIQRLQEELKGRTVILITHRPPLLALAQRIILLDQGKIVSDGPRDTVLKQIMRPQAAA